MNFEIGIYRLDLDIQRTEKYYQGDFDLGCDCDGCKNFENAVHLLPQDVKDFFAQLGVDPYKPAEIYAVHAPEGAELLYGGFYHLCGTILEGKEPWVRISDNHHHLDEQYAIPFSGDFSFFFTSECDLLDADFPRPAIQLEFTGTLPWVLDIPNPYL